MPRHRIAPPTRFPNAVAASYARAMSALIQQMHSITYAAFMQSIAPEARTYQADSLRADGPLDVIIAALEAAKSRTAAVVFTASNILKAAQQFVSGVSVFNKKNIDDQVQKVKGIDPTADEPWLADYMRSSVAENVAYITNLPDDYYRRVTGIVLQGVKNGQSTKDMAKEISKAADVSYNRAKFIAVDQAGSITGQLTAKRHQAAGVRRFKWSTSHDERVRPLHRGFDGHIYNYNNPPDGVPGTAYRCRCVAYPVFDDEVAEDITSPPDTASTHEPESGIIDKTRIFRTPAEVKEWEKEVTPSWLKHLTAEEASSITKYTGSAYANINRRLRAGEESDELTDLISSGLRKFDLRENISVFRGMSRNIFGVGVDEMPGLIFRDLGFTSTSLLNSSSFEGQIEMEIKVPAKSKGSLINPLSHFKDSEYEFLLDKGTTFEILEAWEENDTIKIIAVVISDD